MFTCNICKRVKSLSLTRALFGFWIYSENVADPICICHNCTGDSCNVPALV